LGAAPARSVAAANPGLSDKLLLESLRLIGSVVQTAGVQRARRHQRLFSGFAFGLLALVAELVGRSLTHRLDVGRHVRTPSYSGADYYPFLLAAVKLGVALLLARLVWRFIRARASARAARRVLAAVGKTPTPVPRVRLQLSPRLWLLAFAVTSTFALVHVDAEQAASGRWPLLWPWLHSSALPVFAVLAVLVALAWSAVSRWLNEYERYAEDTCARANRLAAATAAPEQRHATPVFLSPRKLFGLAFESRPPPVPA
jgi:hypothetical protein